MSTTTILSINYGKVMKNFNGKIKINDFKELEENGFWNIVKNPILQKIASEIDLWTQKTEKRNKSSSLFTLVSYSSYREKGRIFAWPEEYLKKVSKQEILFLYANIARIKNIKLKAAFLHILWQYKLLGKDSYKAGKQAIPLYLKNIRTLLEKQKTRNDSMLDVHIRDIIEATLALAIILQNKRARKSVLKICSKLSSLSYSKKDSFLIIAGFEILSEEANTENELKVLFGRVRNIIENAGIEEYYTKRHYYDIAISLCRKLKFKADLITLQKERAYTHILEADLFSETSYKVHHLESALEAYRRIPGCKEICESILKQIKELLPIMHQNVAEISYPGFSNQKKRIKYVEKMIKNKNLADLLLDIADLLDLPSKDNILKFLPKEPSISDFISSKLYDTDGKPVKVIEANSDKTSGIFFHNTLKLYWEDLCRVRLAPLLKKINSEYLVTKEFFDPLCADHPFIPEGHEDLFALGLAYFVRDKMIEAASILIPQIENSLRHILSLQTPMFHIKKDRTYEDKIEIKSILEEALKRKIIDDVLYFNLEKLIIDRSINLRNKLAHGNLKSNYFRSIDMVFCLWIIYWFVMLPFVRQRREFINKISQK